ncbi:hypothetical protein HHI36_017182 [Cryptolaemus montrouzieri]|uniref:Uncharacterized protein n=1 Tax=Cryptolaemus montrouzieri TaxID=559131 RepID=A0ABD2NLQ1_9CUCU
MGGTTICVVCEKTIGKSGYRIQCVGPCKKWTHITYANIKKEDILAKKTLKWTCDNCKKLNESSSSDSDEEVKLEKKRRSKIHKKGEGSEKSTEEMFVQLMEMIDSLEIAVTFNGDMMEGMNKSFEELKKENKNLRKEHEKMQAEVQQLRMDMSTLKEKAISSEISAEVRSRSNNIVMMGVQDQTEVRKIIQFLKVDVTEADMKIKTNPSSRPLKLFVVAFADDESQNHVTDHFMVFVEYSSDDEFCEIKNEESAIMWQYIDYKKLNELLGLESWDIVLRDCSANIDQYWTNFISKIKY